MLMWSTTLLLNLTLHLIDATKSEVTYSLPTIETKYHKKIVEDMYQHEEKKIAEAEISSVQVLGVARHIYGT